MKVPSLMPRLTSLSFRSLLLLMTFVVALPAAGIIIYSGMQLRNMMLNGARTETIKFADRIASEQQNLVLGAEQLMTALAQLPEVKRRDTARVEPILKELLKLNPMYSNIFIADRSGAVWATAVPVPPPFVISDRRYFINAVTSGKLSAGEYVVSRATTRPAFNFAYPLKDDQGTVNGVISIGFVIDNYRKLLEGTGVPAGTSFVMIDHHGIVLARGINPEPYIGKPFLADEFRKMQDGPDSGTSTRIGIGGDKRIISYRKLSLPGEQTPYMYLTAGIPVESITREANRELMNNMALLSSFLLLACIGAVLIGKRSIVDRFKVLENASKRLAAGDLNVRVSDVVVGGELGSLGKTFDVMAEELSERHAERSAAEAALKKSEEKFYRAFMASPEATTIASLADGKYIEVNNIFLEKTGFSKDEVIGRTSTDLNIWVIANERKRFIEELTKTSHLSAFETSYRMRNGEIRNFLVSSEVIELEGHQCSINFNLDVTDQKQAEAEKERLKAQLLQAQKMEAVGQLAGGIAHDFNNILSAIMGYAYLVQTRMSSEDPSRDDIDQILESVHKAAEVTHSLLAFSKKQSMNPKPVRITNIIKRSEKLLSRVIGEDIVMSTSISCDDVKCMVDAGQIEQVLMNLATNARDAMPKGGRLTISTECVDMDESFIRSHGYGRIGKFAVISVSDTGVGMSKDTAERIFEPFFTTKETGKGTGLGLAMAEGIVKQHSGYINASSEPGKGTTFKVYLPAVEPQEHAVAEKITPIPAGGTETILVAEDNEQLRQLSKTILEQEGYKVILANDGDDTIEKFIEQKDKIHLVLIDVVMPKKSGKEVYDEITRITPDIRVIFLSGYTADKINQESFVEGNVDFVFKPILPRDLLSKVRDMLNK